MTLFGLSWGLICRRIALCRRHRQHFESQFEDLQQHYLRMRQRQMGGVKRRRLDESSDADANADADADEASQAPAGSMPAVQAEVGSASDTRGPPGQGWEASTVAAQPRQGAPSPTEPGGLQEFSRMLTMSRRSKLEVICPHQNSALHNMTQHSVPKKSLSNLLLHSEYTLGCSATCLLHCHPLC